MLEVFFTGTLPNSDTKEKEFQLFLPIDKQFMHVWKQCPPAQKSQFSNF